MLKPATVVIALVVTLGAGTAWAQSDCTKTPVQLTSSVTVSPNGSGRGHGTIPIDVTGPTEIQQMTVRIHNATPGTALILISAQVTTQLAGTAVTHGIEVSQSPSFQVAYSEGDLARQVKFYADDGSQVVLDVDLGFQNASPATVDASIVGRTVTPACWGLQ